MKADETDNDHTHKMLKDLHELVIKGMDHNEAKLKAELDKAKFEIMIHKSHIRNLQQPLHDLPEPKRQRD